MRDKYEYIGPVYDFLSALYSGTTIYRCKTAMLEEKTITPGTKVLFAGVGHGRDAIRAAELGANVTVVDLSETMLGTFADIQEKEALHLSIRRVHSDIMELEEFGSYDVVVSNFFLNVFDEERMIRVLDHLIRLGASEVKVIVGDFCYPTGNVLACTFTKIYWYIAALTFWLFTDNALHQIYNYPEYMQRLGLRITEKKVFSLLSINCYWSILGEKRA